MTLTPAFSTSLSGLNAASAKLNRAASDIATTSTPDLAQDVVEMMTAKIMYKANAAVIRTSDEMTGTLLNLRA